MDIAEGAGMTKLEELGRIIQAAYGDGGDEELHGAAGLAARQVVESLLVPTEAMIGAAPDFRDVDLYPSDVWKPMVHAILKEAEEAGHHERAYCVPRRQY